jgi:hypothetical protein
MENQSATPDFQYLAWQGIQVPLMNDWRPLRIEGNYKNGAVTVGDQEGVVFILRWIHPPKKYDAASWIEKRRKIVASGQLTENPPVPEGFDLTSWIKNLAIREETEKTVWWGYSEKSEILVEIILTNLTDRKKNEWFLKKSLPKIKVTPIDEDCLWVIFSARFMIPAGYKLERHRLTVGDITLNFMKNKSDRLFVRQVYPAKLALNRRSLPAWLRDEVFTRHRHFKLLEDDKSIELKTKKSGLKILPFPLSWVSPHHCQRMIIENTELDRLLIIDAEWRDKSDVFNIDGIAKEMGRRVA